MAEKKSDRKEKIVRSELTHKQDVALAHPLFHQEISEKIDKNLKSKNARKIEKIENGFRLYYGALNTHFNELDGGESYLEPITRHIDILYKKITGHYLIYTEKFIGLRKYQDHLVIFDDVPIKEIQKNA